MREDQIKILLDFLRFESSFLLKKVAMYGFFSILCCFIWATADYNPMGGFFTGLIFIVIFPGFFWNIWKLYKIHSAYKKLIEDITRFY